jgi:hypothetical protein
VRQHLATASMHLATASCKDLVPPILIAAVRWFHAQWRKPKIQSKRMIGIGIPISQSNIPLPISELLSVGPDRLAPLANSAHERRNVGRQYSVCIDGASRDAKRTGAQMKGSGTRSPAVPRLLWCSQLWPFSLLAWPFARPRRQFDKRPLVHR